VQFLSSLSNPLNKLRTINTWLNCLLGIVFVYMTQGDLLLDKPLYFLKQVIYNYLWKIGGLAEQS
jgi:hypothetical protein